MREQLPEKLGDFSPIVKIRSVPQWVGECSCGWWVAHSIKANATRRLRLHIGQSHHMKEKAMSELGQCPHEMGAAVCAICYCECKPCQDSQNIDSHEGKLMSESCAVSLACGLVDLPCRLSAAHDGDHKMGNGLFIETELAMKSHEARAIAMARTNNGSDD